MNNMKISVLAILLFASVGFAQPIDDTQVWSPKIDVNNPTKNFIYIWRNKEFNQNLNPSIEVSGQKIPLEIVRFNYNQWYNNRFHFGLIIPKNIQSGIYKVYFDNTSTIITVQNKTTESFIEIPPVYNERYPGELCLNIENAAKTGKTLILTPGYYNLKRALNLPPNTKIKGNNSVLVGLDKFILNPIPEGLIFENVDFVTSEYLAWSDSGGKDSQFLNCTFKGVALGYFNNKNCLFSKCKFVNFSCGPVNGGLFLDCEWGGRPPSGRHSFISESMNNSLAVINARFDSTDRGFVLRANYGPAKNGLFVDCLFKNICWVDNGNEILCLEGNPTKEISNCVFIGFKVFNCDSDITLFNTNINNCVFMDFSLDRSSILFVADDNIIQSGNRIQNCEFRGGGIHFGKNAKNNLVERCAFIAQKPYRINQFYADPILYTSPQYYRPRITANGTFNENAIKLCTWID